MDINKFVENMNIKSRRQVFTKKLKVFIDNKNTEIQTIKLQIIKELGILEYDEKIVMKALNIKNLNRKTIEDQVVFTGERIYTLLSELKTAITKLQGYENLQKNIIDGYISPKYGVNAIGLIGVAEPALARLTYSEIGSLLGFTHIKTFDTFKKLCAFINKYKEIIIKIEEESSFIVVGMTLFCTLERVELWDIAGRFEREYTDIHINDIPFEPLEIMREGFKKLKEGRMKITVENFELFDKIYKEMSPKIEPTKCAKAEGLLEEEWFAFFPLDGVSEEALNDPFYEYNRENLIKEHEDVKKSKEDWFNDLYNQYTFLKEKMEKGNTISAKEETTSKIKIEKTKPFEIYESGKEANIAKMRSRGWSEELIERNLLRIKKIEDDINNSYYNSYYTICEEQYYDTIFDFVASGKGQLKVLRMIFDSKNEDGDMIYDLYVHIKDIRHILKVVAPKGTAHRTLVVTLPDNTIQTYTASNKKSNIKQMAVGVLNTLC
ncbi:hypothetical protein I6U48_26600 [Clostridium sp. PL3]|uniref:Uncharacterized protein n=1 Tax=Clostridium thailandense TaxID=2794346 RepID=A0A949WTL1_9CLOT|nr:hypothetical protein [Clostridium thailandense]MBV7276455.1 hypothetical protein [Clostridium thailandense]